MLALDSSAVDPQAVEGGRPKLSIVIPTIRGWPDSRIALDPLMPQAERFGAELIVIDGSRHKPPADLPAFVKWVSKPGWSVFQLRALGYAEAHGDIVAVTEDHCIAEPDWCERILAAHEEYPDALAIGGSVENGAEEKLADWAAFFLTQAPYMAPLENGPARIIAAPVNVSYKRAALERLIAAEGEGVIDFMEMTEEERALFVTDDRIRVRHDLSKSFWSEFARSIRQRPINCRLPPAEHDAHGLGADGNGADNAALSVGADSSPSARQGRFPRHPRALDAGDRVVPVLRVGRRIRRLPQWPRRLADAPELSRWRSASAHMTGLTYISRVL